MAWLIRMGAAFRSDREKVAPPVAQPFRVNPIYFIKVKQIHALGLDRKRFRSNAICFSALLVVLLLGIAQSQAEERIVSFDSLVEIAGDGTLTVTETIEVIAEGNEIKRGIYRDFPTVYKGPMGLNEDVGFEVISVSRDGRSDPWFTEDLGNGVRVYFGEESVFLTHGRHTYQFVYQTNRQIAFFDDFDELTWNATGDAWAFPIDQARVRIRLPGNTEPIEGAVYTGAYGETGSDATLRLSSNGATATTTQMLWPGEGMTISVSFPKGAVSESSRSAGLLGANLGLVLSVLGLVATTIYFVVTWHRIGRDPQKGTVIPRFDAPKGLSPVATGYVWYEGFTHKFDKDDAFAAALVSLATKGVITIEQDGKDFTLARTGKNAELSPGEAAIMEELLSGEVNHVTLTRTYDPDVKSAVTELLDAVKSEYEGVYHRQNLGYWFLGAGLALVTGFAGMLIDARSMDGIFFLVFFGMFGLVFGVGAWFIIKLCWRALIKGIRGNWRQIPGALAGLIASGMFGAPAIFVAIMTFEYVSAPMVAVLVLMIALCITFAHLLKRPTAVGRVALDHLEGYRLYLSVAESNRLAMTAGEPEMTPQLFERHLPYAMALGVADAWEDKFDALAPDEIKADYHPVWYLGDSGSRGYSGLASGMGSALSSTVSSAAKAPSSSSSSSSGGGGFSGGGGGGGGGGGW